MLAATSAQRLQERLETAADGFDRALAVGIATLEEDLARLVDTPAPRLSAAAQRLGENLAPGAIVLVFGEGGVEPYPRSRLLFQPDAPEPDPAIDDVFRVREGVD